MYHDYLGDTIKATLTTSYAGPANPQKLSDLGNTNYTSSSLAPGTNSTNVNISINVSIDYSAAFQGQTSQTNIESQNPGLFREVKAHEESHKDQILDAALKPISINVDIDGRSTTFSGSADDVILQAMTAFNGSNTAKEQKEAQNSAFLRNSIVIPALTEVGNNINNSVYNNPNVETMQ
ncbi:hypothetical protein [uncultured Roseivirga sp.]|uniref:hypothetical protein n=1 Tax=uncultured Roseivirga sp. TaxID=543088 RepID=UPI002597EC9E|nr:hypothetical protein [uncultured Roseivirga sp.]|tara:strand:+ start:1569 stop:2105 length:537 start_codon:yes stop_codon:yes gene_type:complete